MLWRRTFNLTYYFICFYQAPTSDREKFFFAIDRGGTFTDVLAHCPGGRVRTMKLLSEDPRYPDAPREGIRRILQEVIIII